MVLEALTVPQELALHQTLAAMIVSSHVGVSKEMATFRREGFIEPQGKDRIVLVEGLVSMNPQPVFVRSSSLCE